jgi:hypothetical protein
MSVSLSAGTQAGSSAFSAPLTNNSASFFGIAARMDDEVRTSECRNRLRPQQSVRIRNDTDAHFKGSSGKSHHRTGTQLSNSLRLTEGSLLYVSAHACDGLMVQ